MSVRILHGDCRDIMRRLIADGTKVDCCVTSPPYWGLRDYGVEGQIGLEPTLGAHIETMVDVFRLVRDLLKDDGTLWLNYGDCYATTPNGRSAAEVKAHGMDDRTFRDKPFSTVGPIYKPIDNKRCGFRSGDRQSRQEDGGRIHAGGYLKPKDLCMIPNRLAIALQEDGWWVRSEIIWHKPNPMPESVRDRPTCSHEKIFLLSKSQRYFYDAEAVRIQAQQSSIDRWSQDLENQRGSDRANGGTKTNGTMKAVGSRNDKQRGHSRRHNGFNDRWDNMSAQEQRANGANLRNVWTIATSAFREAHFATFPPDLAETCIKAGCRDGGTVFDPFGGAGTTGLVADRLNRNAILIELNPNYADMALNRIQGDAPLTVDASLCKGAV